MTNLWCPFWNELKPEPVKASAPSSSEKKPSSHWSVREQPGSEDGVSQPAPLGIQSIEKNNEISATGMYPQIHLHGQKIFLRKRIISMTSCESEDTESKDNPPPPSIP